MRVTNCCFVALISCYHRAVHGYIHQTSSRPHFPRFSLDCNTAAEKFPAEEENPPSVAAVELTPFNDEIRAVLGRTPDKLAQNMYAIGAMQGSSVFKLVGELENLSEALEKTVADMAIVAQKLKEEREAMRQEKLKKTLPQEPPILPTTDNR